VSARVYLVGAGPGDPGLMTVRARELIAQADVVLHDQLIPPGALDGAREDAIVVDVGKRGGGAQVPQDDTNAQLLEHARAGRIVVRLKGGDPFVFGRGGEEALLLAEHGIAFEVVPGVTAGVAASAYAGIPVTQRGLASAVAFVTGHEDPGKPETAIDWGALAAFPGTLVFYMGVRQLDRIARSLIDAGRAADEPAAIVQSGTLAGQRELRATLATIAQRAQEQAFAAPSITIVGPVAALADRLAWLGERPLAGRRVAVLRARPQASPLAARLRALGADVIEAPAIAIEPLDAQLPDLAGYDLLCVTSPNGVARLLELVRDARALAGPRIAAIGPGTAAALRAGGIEPDVVPDRSVAEGLVEALCDVDRRSPVPATEGRNLPITRALIVRAQTGRDVLPDALRGRGAQVDIIAVYRTVPQPLDDASRAAVLSADDALFTSASTVEALVTSAGGPDALRDGPRLCSIGPATSEALRAHGLEPGLEAAVHTPDGLVDALLESTT
jgi:uroporphyrinogen III methyltransferase / synthase